MNRGLFFDSPGRLNNYHEVIQHLQQVNIAECHQVTGRRLLPVVAMQLRNLAIDF